MTRTPSSQDEIVARGAAPGGLTWHYARPPVEGLEYEMDVRGVRGRTDDLSAAYSTVTDFARLRG